MKLHNLKIKWEYSQALSSGNKTFEIRKNDRDFQVGDLIYFEVIDKPDQGKDYERWVVSLRDHLLWQITYVLKDVPEYGLDKDYCILSIKKVEVK